MKRTAKGEVMTELVLETFRLNGTLLEAGNQMTAPHGLTSARWQVMGAIDLAKQPLTVAQIARRMGLARQGVQRIANDLKRLGLITSESNIDHKRAPLMSITDEGAKALREVNKAQISWVNQISEGLSVRRIEQAIETLRIVGARSDRIEPGRQEN